MTKVQILLQQLNEFYTRYRPGFLVFCLHIQDGRSIDRILDVFLTFLRTTDRGQYVENVTHAGLYRRSIREWNGWGLFLPRASQVDAFLHQDNALFQNVRGNICLVYSVTPAEEGESWHIDSARVIQVDQQGRVRETRNTVLPVLTFRIME